MLHCSRSLVRELLAEFKDLGLRVVHRVIWWIEGDIWGLPQIRGTFLGVPVISTIVYWGLYWGTLIYGNYHIFCLGEASCIP